MAAIFLLMLATFQLATAQQESTTIALVVIKGNGEEICHSPKEIEDGLLEIRSNVNTILQNYSPKCGEDPWYRVAYLNMTDPTQQCPTAWRRYNDSGVKACGRAVSSGASCSATFYPTGCQYSKVCGRVTGYQVGSPNAFYAASINPRPSRVDEIYVDGVTITHGYPRKHIWTLAAGITEEDFTINPEFNCPCSRQGAIQVPTYVGNNYYCESGNNGTNYILENIYSSDPLWDGQQCEGQCCANGKSPPWFSVELPNPTADDIEVRICANEDTDNEDTPVNLVEIYVI